MDSVAIDGLFNVLAKPQISDDCLKKKTLKLRIRAPSAHSLIRLRMQ